MDCNRYCGEVRKRWIYKRISIEKGKYNMKYDGNTDKVIDLIKHAMIDTRTQQKDIVEKTGLNKGTISNFLNYKSSNPTLDTLKMYCDAMGCDLVIDIVPRIKEEETDHA